MDDLIRRQAAIDALRKLREEDIEDYGCEIPEGFNQDHLDRATFAIKQLQPIQPEPHWIPVTERLPEKHGAYIVCYSDFRHGIYYGRVIAVAWFDVEDTWLKYRYADNARTFPPRLHHVIAWMPLPEPYKGVTE